MARSVRRIQHASAAGYWTVLLHVHVSLETAIRRNKSRARTAPTAVLEKYQAKLLKAVDAQKNEVNEYVVFDNDTDDGLSGRHRWGALYYWYNQLASAAPISEDTLIAQTRVVFDY